MRIVHLVTSLNPGGITNFVGDLISELENNGIKNEIIVTNSVGLAAPKIRSMNIPIHTCLSHGTTDIKWSYRAGKLIRKSAILTYGIRLTLLLRRLQPDIVHSHIHGQHWSTQIIAAHQAGARFLIQLHSPSSGYPASWRGKRIFPRLVRPEDRIVAETKSAYKVYKDLSERFPGQMVLIPLGLRDPLSQSESKKFRYQFGVSDHTIIVGTVSRLIAQKRIDVIISAIHQLIQDGRDILLWIVGDGVERKNLENQVNISGIGDKVTFLGFVVDQFPWYRAFDIFVISSMYEGCPVALLEAMAFALPVIGTNVPGTQDVIQHEVNGLLIPPDNAEALATAIRRFIDDPDLRLKLGDRSRKSFQENYEISKRAQSYLDLYSEMLTNKQR